MPYGRRRSVSLPSSPLLRRREPLPTGSETFKAAMDALVQQQGQCDCEPTRNTTCNSCQRSEDDYKKFHSKTAEVICNRTLHQRFPKYMQDIPTSSLPNSPEQRRRYLEQFGSTDSIPEHLLSSSLRVTSTTPRHPGMPRSKSTVVAPRFRKTAVTFAPIPPSYASPRTNRRYPSTSALPDSSDSSPWVTPDSSPRTSRRK